MNETIKNTPIKTQYLFKLTILMFGIFVPMLLLFLFGGEINLNQQNWLVAQWGKLWGSLKDGTIGFGINSGDPIISWQPFVIAVSIILSVTLIFLILVKFKLIEMMFFSIMFSSWFVLFSVLISGLLYANPDPDSTETWKIFVRLVIILTSFIIIFFPLNWILNTIMIHSKNAQTLTEKIIDNEIQTVKYIKENVDIIKPKKKKKVTSIDVQE